MSAQVDFAELRRRMVESQLRARDIVDERVLAAMGQVPRERFVPPEHVAAAYDDCALPIGCGQTISQPYTVAYMCQAAHLRGDEKVLEIGAGSGYAAAVLSLLAHKVYGVERIAELAVEARRRLAVFGYANVHITPADDTLGRPDEAPFDAILVSAGADRFPDELRSQLAPGGRIVIPVGEYGSGQTMYRFTEHAGRLEAEDLGAFSFVPLVRD